MFTKDNTNQIFKFNTTPPTTKESIRKVLQDDDCFRDVMQAIHGNAGSKAFNQAKAVAKFLGHDQLNGAVITSKMDAGELNHRQVWLHMNAVLKSHEKQCHDLMLEMAK